MPRTSTAVARKPKARAPRALDLPCPECTAEIRVEPRDLVEGHAVHCDRCGTDGELTQEFDEATGRHRWILVDPMADYDADERPRT